MGPESPSREESDQRMSRYSVGMQVREYKYTRNNDRAAVRVEASARHPRHNDRSVNGEGKPKRQTVANIAAQQTVASVSYIIFADPLSNAN